MTPCTIKDYLLYIGATDEAGVYESHVMIFDVIQFHVDSEANPSLITESRKTHPNGRRFSYGNLNLKFQKYNVLNITIGKNPTTPSPNVKLGSIKKAMIALTITMQNYIYYIN